MDEAEAGSSPERLLRMYRRYVGEPDRVADVYVGFALFFAGVTAAILGLLVFLWSTNLSGTGVYWQLREISIAAAMLGLPAFLLSVVILLPVDRRTIGAGAIGGVICLLAVGFFVMNYPYNWDDVGGFTTAAGLTTYGIGIVVSTGTVGAALVSNYVENVEGGTDSDDTAGERIEERSQITDEQVRADIDEEVAAADLSWGGVESSETKQLSVNSTESDGDQLEFNIRKVSENRAASDDVDTAVAGLRNLRGGETTTATGDGTDEQADALKNLRERQAAEANTHRPTLVDRIRKMIDI